MEQTDFVYFSKFYRCDPFALVKFLNKHSGGVTYNLYKKDDGNFMVVVSFRLEAIAELSSISEHDLLDMLAKEIACKISDELSTR